MRNYVTSIGIPTAEIKGKALASMAASVEQFCRAAGLEGLAGMIGRGRRGGLRQAS